MDPTLPRTDLILSPLWPTASQQTEVLSHDIDDLALSACPTI
jgi:hypothetical protein